MDEALQKMHHILDTTTKNKEEIEDYEMKLKAEMDYNNNISNAIEKGIEKGIEKDRNDAMITVAKKMKEIKMPVEEIVKLTNIPKEKITKL
jgi:predicted transposase/invertase (TIGR01784 family)